MKIVVSPKPAPKFKPITVTITIESLEELRSLTARADINPKTVLDQVNSTGGGYGEKDLCRVTELYCALAFEYKAARA